MRYPLKYFISVTKVLMYIAYGPKVREQNAATKESKCMSDKIQKSVDAVSKSLLGGRVTGEEDVPVETANIKMKSAKKTPAELAGPMTTPGSDAKMGIPGDAVDPDSDAPVDIQAKSWAVNPFGFLPGRVWDGGQLHVLDSTIAPTRWQR